MIDPGVGPGRCDVTGGATNGARRRGHVTRRGEAGGGRGRPARGGPGLEAPGIGPLLGSEINSVLDARTAQL